MFSTREVSGEDPVLEVLLGAPTFPIGLQRRSTTDVNCYGHPLCAGGYTTAKMVRVLLLGFGKFMTRTVA